jgi:hypothetical protein
MLTAAKDLAARELREDLLRRLLAVDAELGAVARELVNLGSPWSGSRLIEARKAVASVAVGVLEAR